MEMDNKIKYEINVNNGQAIFAGNSATIYATQNNGNEDINKKIACKKIQWKIEYFLK